MPEFKDFPDQSFKNIIKQIIIELQKSGNTITPGIAALIKFLLLCDCLQHNIAAWIGVNQGRISEIKNGKRFADVPPASINLS